MRGAPPDEAKEEGMKIVIVGPGAMGLLLATFLVKSSEEDIWLLDKDPQRACLLNQQGIFMEGIAGERQVRVKATHQVEEIGKADLLIICVKAYDTKAAMLRAKPLVGEDTLVLTLQNGLGNIEILAEIIGQDKVIGGTASLGATLLDVGKVRFAGKGEIIIGRLDGKISVGMRQLRQLLNKVGLETRISRDIKSFLWSKLIINVGINALTAITRLPNGKLIESEFTRNILRSAVTEAVKVAKKKRIRLISDDPLTKVEAVCEATASNISSMLQDILKKKRSEIDFINGVIVRHAQELGIAAPVNSVLVDLVKTIESTYNLAIT